MLLLTRVRIVNWHFFRDSIIEVKPATLLAGDNGTGKSTIIDAIQYALIAQVGRIRFNAAASERRAARTLESYCRCKIGADSLDFIRGDCISHVIVEFADGERRFCAGIMVEAFVDGDCREHEWIADGARIADVVVYDGSQFLTPRDFRERIKQAGGVLCATKREYNNRLTHLLGVHRRGADFNPYLEAIARSVSFTPFTSVHEFVCNYILDEHFVDVGAMKENLENYRAAEREAIAMQARIDSLVQVEEAASALAQVARQIERQEYFRHRISAEAQREAVRAAARGLEETTIARARLEDRLAAERERKERLDTVRQELTFALSSDESHRLYERLRRDIEETDSKIVEQEKRAGRSRTLVAQSEAMLGRPLAADFAEEQARLELEERDAGAQSAAAVLEIERLKTELAALAAEARELESGILRHPAATEELKDALEKAGIPAAVFADLLEVTDEEWHDAVEGWLDTQRFNVLVPEDDFARALAIYDALPAGTAGVGLPNMIRIHDIEVRPGSLAEAVEAATPAARRYAAFLMGDVVRTPLSGLKDHERSISSRCMRYSDHTALRIKEDVYRRWYIGKQAKVRRLAELGRLIEESGRGLERAVAGRRSAEERLELIRRVMRSLSEVALLADAPTILARLRNEHAEIRKTLDSIDTSSFEAIKKQIAAVSESHAEVQKSIDGSLQELGAARQRAETFSAALESAGAELKRRTAVLEGYLASRIEYESDLASYYDERMRAELKGGPVDYDDLLARSETAYRNSLTRQRNARDQLMRTRQRFNHEFNMLLPLEDDSARDYLALLGRYRETELPEYRDRISRARGEAERQFREHFVSRLNEYLIEAEDNFQEINHILEQIRFGKDQYRFTIARRPERRDLMAAIATAAEVRETEGTLFAALKTDEERRSIEDLFDQVLKHDSGSPEIRDLCDYRQYFSYDIRVRHTDTLDASTGKPLESFLSKVLREKSGGETQTPYYVALAASFFRFYRDAPNAVRLVLFDEAFNKMDDERIAKIIDFLRKLNLQVITAVPTEKIESIAPHVDCTNLVLRRNYDAFVRDYHILSREPAPA